MQGFCVILLKPSYTGFFMLQTSTYHEPEYAVTVCGV